MRNKISALTATTLTFDYAVVHPTQSVR